jgi:SAM-dependent methyltransferase/uncharacterized protein YbaR (Trm112 family)
VWVRLADWLRCPECRGKLALRVLEEAAVEVAPELQSALRQRGVENDRYVESGLLVCSGCMTMYPIVDGLPILLRYETPMCERFRASRPPREFADLGAHHFPRGVPPAGEQAVMRSFSKEWLDYDYDGVIWEMDYADHERRFLEEIGPGLAHGRTERFLEVGCGLGITTCLAHKNSGADAVGVDLSLAVWKASRHYRNNPFLHFVQASAFAMPFADASFDAIYSRGVLHHTRSTEEAFASIAPLARPGGVVYLWVYGVGSIRETPLRRALYGLERMFRPALSANPESVPARAFLTAMGFGYVLFNAARRAADATIQPLTLTRGIHAARDRFTPEYAHRHESFEVTEWFRRAGFDEVQALDWRAMPSADHDDFRRNVGVRGRRNSQSA